MAREVLVILDKLKAGLEAGTPARLQGFDPKDIKDFYLLTAKPVLYVGNTDETPDPAYQAALEALAKERGAEAVTVCGKLESEIGQLGEEDRAMFMKELGLTLTGLERVIVAAYKLLGQCSYFTCGPEEVRAWTITVGWKAPQAAGVIHTDFEKGFIKADIYSYKDIDVHLKEAALREKGLIASQGKDYVMRDGDVCFFKFSS